MDNLTQLDFYKIRNECSDPFQFIDELYRIFQTKQRLLKLDWKKTHKQKHKIPGLPEANCQACKNFYQDIRQFNNLLNELTIEQIDTDRLQTEYNIIHSHLLLALMGL